MDAWSQPVNTSSQIFAEYLILLPVPVPVVLDHYLLVEGTWYGLQVLRSTLASSIVIGTFCQHDLFGSLPFADNHPPPYLT